MFPVTSLDGAWLPCRGQKHATSVMTEHNGNIIFIDRPWSRTLAPIALAKCHCGCGYTTFGRSAQTTMGSRRLQNVRAKSWHHRYRANVLPPVFNGRLQPICFDGRHSSGHHWQGISSGYGACMSGQFEIATHQDLFRHVTADNAALYRCVLDVCAAAERQLLLYVRPSEFSRKQSGWASRRPPPNWTPSSTS